MENITAFNFHKVDNISYNAEEDVKDLFLICCDIAWELCCKRVKPTESTFSNYGKRIEINKDNIISTFSARRILKFNGNLRTYYNSCYFSRPEISFEDMRKKHIAGL